MLKAISLNINSLFKYFGDLRQVYTCSKYLTGSM